jgi:hypothetical protein
MGVTPGRVSQIEHGEVSTVEALASYIAALGGRLELIADIGGHLLKMPANPAAYSGDWAAELKLGTGRGLGVSRFGWTPPRRKAC